MPRNPFHSLPRIANRLNPFHGRKPSNTPTVHPDSGLTPSPHAPSSGRKIKHWTPPRKTRKVKIRRAARRVQNAQHRRSSNLVAHRRHKR